MSTETISARAWQLPASIPEDLAAFDKNVAQFKAGTISPTQFQVFRVPQGVYEQRENGTYMLRVRFPGGVALPHQLRTLAEVAAAHANGVLHVTTRQDIQLHGVLVDSIHPALAALATAGLSTKGGGGNTVRNITGDPEAGVAADEVFDVTPHVLRLTEFLLADLASFQLPRKYKIAFSGSAADRSGATVNDLGFIAKRRDGVDGFSVWIGGGLGSASRVADAFEDFVPADEVPYLAEAVKRVFNTHGNRKDRRQARLRFLIRQIGLEAFRRLYAEQLALVRSENLALPALRQLRQPELLPTAQTPAHAVSASPAFTRWRATNVQPQKQSGFFRVELPLVLGDIPSAKLRLLAAVVDRFGERQLRTSQKQNLVLRWVREDQLPALHAALEPLGLGAGRAPVLRDLVACTGAANCRLGICLSRGLAQAVADALAKSSVDLHAVGELQVNISGCPNSCGRHPIADIGLAGSARRIDGRLVPHYTVQFGGHVEEGSTVLATGKHSVPAHRVPAFLVDLLDAYARSSTRPDFGAFQRTSGSLIDRLVEKHRPVPSFKEDRNFYYDWGSEELFSLAGRGPGECGAGVLDLIEVDLKSAAEALAEKRYYAAAVLSARALLVTRGEQANNDREAFTLFRRHFLEADLGDSAVVPVLLLGEQAAAAPEPASAFTGSPEATAAFVATIQALFKSMDGTLQFPKRTVSPSTPAMAAPPPGTAPAADATKDFRGVACPLNYVKTKMALGPLKPGQTLAVLLDEAGARNVPDSAAKDGHEVLSVVPHEGAFRVAIRKRDCPPQ
ncbi:MAG: sulfurtransferase TusA family protein [Opitutaceae bacterium]